MNFAGSDGGTAAPDESPAVSIALSERAARRIEHLLSLDENRGLTLRVIVTGGGCSGFQYGFSFDDERNEDDIAIERDGAIVLIDEVSFEYLAGAEIDFKEELVGSYFSINNPNATSICGCGTSFALG